MNTSLLPDEGQRIRCRQSLFVEVDASWGRFLGDEWKFLRVSDGFDREIHMVSKSVKHHG